MTDLTWRGVPGREPPDAGARSAIADALEHHRRAIRAGLEGDEGTCAAALLCCCEALIVIAQRQQEQITTLSARVRQLENDSDMHQIRRAAEADHD